MGWTITHALDRFEAEAGPFLRRHPIENSVPLSLCRTLRRRGLQAFGAEPPVFGWWRRGGDGGRDGGGDVSAAFLRTPPQPLLLTRGEDEAARDLAATIDGPQAAIRGDGEAAGAFAEVWRDRTGATATVERAMRLYRLGTLTPKEPGPPGSARVAGTADRALLLSWREEFAADVGVSPAGGEQAVDDAIAYGGRTVWEAGGEPVAMAGVTPAEGGAVRIVAVYTPERHRGRGYGGAVTAAVSRAARAAGADDVVLFADLANPVSNGLYGRLGFAPVRDHVSITFTRPVS